MSSTDDKDEIDFTKSIFKSIKEKYSLRKKLSGSTSMQPENNSFHFDHSGIGGDLL